MQHKKQMNRLIDFFLRIIETTSARLNVWSWHKRWNNKDKSYGYKK